MVGGLRFDDPDAAEKWAEDTLLLHSHTLAQRWLVDPNTRRIYHKAMLHDALLSFVKLLYEVHPHFDSRPVTASSCAATSPPRLGPEGRPRGSRAR